MKESFFESVLKQYRNPWSKNFIMNTLKINGEINISIEEQTDCQQLLVMEHANTILEKSTLSYNSVKSIMASVRRLCNINIDNHL